MVWNAWESKKSKLCAKLMKYWRKVQSVSGASLKSDCTQLVSSRTNIKKYHRGAGELSNSNKLRDPDGYSMAAKVWNMSRNSDNFFALAPDSIEAYFANTFSNWNIILKKDDDKKTLDMGETNLCYKGFLCFICFICFICFKSISNFTPMPSAECPGKLNLKHFCEQSIAIIAALWTII